MSKKQADSPSIYAIKLIRERLAARNVARDRYYGVAHLAPGEADRFIKIMYQWEEYDAAKDMETLLLLTRTRG
jgi:hypothetical protein